LEFRVIDYSSTFYGTTLPPVRSGKFLQIVDAGEEIETVLLSPYDLSKYHAQILERYCFLNGIAGRFLKNPDLYQVTGAAIEVVGGGHWKLDGGLLRLMGESTMYGKYRPDGLAEKIRAIPEYRALDVAVE
jgi:hypothetical protein